MSKSSNKKYNKSTTEPDITTKPKKSTKPFETSETAKSIETSKTAKPKISLLNDKYFVLYLYTLLL